MPLDCFVHFDRPFCEELSDSNGSETRLRNWVTCIWRQAANGDIGDTKFVVRYRTLKRDLPECQ